MLNPQLINIVARVFNVSETDLIPEMGVGDLDAWDSLGHLRLMMEIEYELNVRLSTEQIRTLTSVAEIQTALFNKG